MVPNFAATGERVEERASERPLHDQRWAKFGSNQVAIVFNRKYFASLCNLVSLVLNGSTIECNAWVRLIYFCTFYGVTPNYIEKLEKCFNCDAFLLRSGYIIIDNAAHYFSDDTATKWLMKNGMLQIFWFICVNFENMYLVRYAR